MRPVVLAALVVVPRLVDAQGSAPRSLNAVLEPVRARAGVPALGAAIVTGRGLIAVGAVGVREAGSPTRVTTEDRWHLGSDTKTMTATLVARLVDRGVVRWETTIGEAWGPLLPTVHAAWRDVTLLQLVSHRSGARWNFDSDVWWEVARSGAPLAEQRRRLAESLFREPPQHPVDSITRYSNAGMMVAAATLEVVTGEPWETLVTREVFRPLGMTTAGFGAPGGPGPLLQPRGHLLDGAGWSPIPWERADHPPVTGPVGAAHASLADWGRFVAAHLRGARGDSSYLSRAQWTRLHTPGRATWDYTPGWKRVRDGQPNGITLEHPGSNGLWLSQASIAPDSGYAVLITANGFADALEQPFAALVRTLSDSALRMCPAGSCRPRARRSAPR